MTAMGPDRPPAAHDVRLRSLDPGQLDLLEPLWRALLDRIRVPGNVVPIVPHERSWPMRRAEYRRLLSGGDSFGIVAHRGDDPIGYAVVRVGDMIYDGSIANQLEKLRQQMIDRSVHEIQSRRDRFRPPARD